jgi:hypothetical protein
MALASFVFHCDCFALPTLAFTASCRLASNLVTSLIAVSTYLFWLMLGELSLPHVFETLTRRIGGELVLKRFPRQALLRSPSLG